MKEIGNFKIGDGEGYAEMLRYHAQSKSLMVTASETGMLERLSMLKKHGVKAGGLFSKSWDVFEKQDFDYVVTVCDSAASETCPVFAGGFKKLHWSLPDPAGVTGSEDAVTAAFEDTFAALKSRIESELL